MLTQLFFASKTFISKARNNLFGPNPFDVINEMCSNQNNLRIFLIQFNLIQSFTGQLTRSDVITILLADTLDAENQTLSVSEVRKLQYFVCKLHIL